MTTKVTSSPTKTTKSDDDSPTALDDARVWVRHYHYDDVAELINE
jgi:hypothetical protein